MDIHAGNTAIVLDSTADYPEGPERFPNWRVVPLYVRFGDESFKDYVELSPNDFYARLRSSKETPTTSQPTPGDFLATYEELGAYDRILSLHIPQKLSGTVESARQAGEALGGGKVRAIDSGTVSAGLALLALAVQRRSTRGRPTRTCRRGDPAGESRHLHGRYAPIFYSGAAGSGRRRR